jgi:hypothetical protein
MFQDNEIHLLGDGFNFKKSALNVPRTSGTMGSLPATCCSMIFGTIGDVSVVAQAIVDVSRRGG